MIYPTYKYKYGPRTRVSSRCPLCGENGPLILQKRIAEVRLNNWIPLGNYREIQATCLGCEKEYLITPDLSRTLLPGKVEKRLFLAAWLTLPVPFLSLLLMSLAFFRSPKTSNYIRSWTKIGFLPATLIALAFVGFLFSV